MSSGSITYASMLRSIESIYISSIHKEFSWKSFINGGAAIASTTRLPIRVNDSCLVDELGLNEGLDNKFKISLYNAALMEVGSILNKDKSKQCWKKVTSS